MHRKSLLEDRVCLLFLSVCLSVTISFSRDVKPGAVQASDGNGQQLLEQGEPLVREVAEGEIHSYRVDLKVGEFLHVVIRQLGVNVAATLIAPDGQKLLEADTPRSTQEAEWLTCVAERSGTYSIEVRTVDKGAPRGRFEIKIEEQRKSTASDEARVSAQKASTEATRLFGEKNYSSAIGKYLEALAMYRQSRRQVEEAVTLNCIARSSVSVYDYQVAIERHKEALSIYRGLSDVNGEGTT
ncbi:MAG: hypothetical protein ND895_15125, partial [Pyrinomonadaceae bacterium]|nr:hypothetical protein [Pyrinomonadaceae bacterium]